MNFKKPFSLIELMTVVLVISFFGIYSKFVREKQKPTWVNTSMNSSIEKYCQHLQFEYNIEIFVIGASF